MRPGQRVGGFVVAHVASSRVTAVHEETKWVHQWTMTAAGIYAAVASETEGWRSVATSICAPPDEIEKHLERGMR